jgi:PST family polysaccharide transporter
MTDGLLGSRVAAGAAWMLGFRLLDRSIGIGSLMILARLLVPGDFGLVAMASSIVAIVELLNAFGFDVALIQKSDATRAHFDTAWTLGLAMAGACALLVAAAAFPASAFYGEPRLAPVLGLLALSTLIRGFENIGVVAFRKELEFAREFRLLLLKRAVVFLATVAAALATRSYWALVLGNLLGSIVGVVLSYALHPYRPRLGLGARAELMRFSKWMLLGNAVNTLAQRTSDFMVGRWLGAAPLGLFNLAQEVANLPTTELSAPINRATYPGYARVAADPAQLRSQFLDVQGLTALLTTPAAIGIAVIAPLVVPLLLGDGWREAIPLLGILAISGLLASWRTNINYVFMAMDRSRLVTALAALRCALVVPALAFGTRRFGTTGAACAVLAMSLAMLPITQVFASRVLEVGWKQHGAVLWRPVLGSIAMGLSLAQMLDWLGGGWLALAVALVLGGVVYLAAIAALWAAAGFPDSAETQVRNAVMAGFARLRQH